MSTELQLLNGDRSTADIFFDQEPIITDWDQVRKDVKAGVITSGECLNQIRAMEPLLEQDDPREHQHWVWQQKLRLALLQERNEPLETKETCLICGARPTDHLFGDSYYECCLHCAEHNKQVPDLGSRGSMVFLQAVFNPRTLCFGLLFYWSMDRDDTFTFMLADFYKTRQEAEMAIWPIQKYSQWLNRQTDSMSDHCTTTLFRYLLNISEVMTWSLPLTPDQFREKLRQRIETNMYQEHAMMKNTVKEALRQRERAERD